MRHQRMVAAAMVLVVAAACSPAVPLTSPGVTAPAGAQPTAPPTTDASGGSLSSTGFPAQCPAVADSFEVMNDSTYQVFGEVTFTDEQGVAALGHSFIGTAWVVRPNVLATNAHVVNAFLEAAGEGARITRALAVQAGTGTVVALERSVMHPNYTGNPIGSPDVGLFITEQPLAAPLPLAPADSVMDLGDPIQLVGFPGDVEDFIRVVPGETIPQATSLSGAISARRSWDDREAVTRDTLNMYQHQAPTTPGTSGSAIFHCGLVAAVNNAGTTKLVLSPVVGSEGEVQVQRQAAAANNFGVHVRALYDLLALFDADQLQAVDLPVPVASVPGGGGPGGPMPGATPPGITPPVGVTPPPVGVTPPPVGVEPGSLIGNYVGAVIDDQARHELAFAVAPNGQIAGISRWPQTGDFSLAGQMNADGTFVMTDNAPERLGFRRGIYQGAIAPDGTGAGIYFEQTQEQVVYQFVIRRSP